MKAYRIDKPGNIDNLSIVDIKKPTPKNDEALVKVKGSSINPADVKVATGKDGANFIHSNKSPVRIGFDFSGIIEEITDGKDFKVGDEVYGFLPYSSKTVQGSYSEYLVVKINSIAKKPKSTNHHEAASAATTGLTALQSLVNLANIKNGDKVLINGASGGVGSFAVQIAKSFNTEVWGTCSSKNIDFIKSLGTDKTIDYKATKLNEIDEKFDIILDAVSNSSFLDCSRLLNKNGTYITLMPSFRVIIGMILSFFTSKKSSLVIVKSKKEDLELLAKLIDEKKVKSKVNEIYSIEKLKQALKSFDSNGAKGKIGIDFEDWQN